MEVIDSTAEIGQTFPQPNTNNNCNIPSLQCRIHQGYDILYLNTDIKGQIMLCCQQCVIYEGIESKKLFSLKMLNSEGDILQYLWSFKENKEILLQYQQLKKVNFKEEREKIIKLCKNLRVKLDTQIYELENQLILYNEILQDHLINIQQFNNQFQEQLRNQMNQFKVNEIQLENVMRGNLLDFELNKNKIFEQLQNVKSMIEKGPIKIANDYEQSIEKFLIQLQQSKENQQESQKFLQILLCTSNKVQGENQQLKNQTQFDISNQDEENLFNQKLISICQECQQETIEIQLQKKCITLQKNYTKDIQIDIFLKQNGLENPHGQLKIPLFNCTQNDIKLIVNQYFQSKVNQKQLIVVINGNIVDHDQILDIEEIKSLQVFQVTDQQLNKEETILYKVNICQAQQFGFSVQYRQQMNANTVPEQIRYIQIPKQQTESFVEAEILSFLKYNFQKIFDSVNSNNNQFYQNRQNQRYIIIIQEKLSQQDINYMKQFCSISKQSGQELGINNYLSQRLVQNEELVQQIYIFIQEKNYLNFTQNPKIIQANSDLTNSIMTIQLSRSMNCYEDQRLKNYSLHCSNCQIITDQRITQQYEVVSDSIIFDISNFPCSCQSIGLKTLFNFQTNSNEYQLSKCIMKNQNGKLYFLKCQKDLNLWRIEGYQNLLKGDELVNFIPYILIYVQNEQEQQNTEQQEILNE